MKSMLPAETPDYLFLELLDRYVRRVADACDLPAVTEKRELLNKVDLSGLPAAEQAGFYTWLADSFYVRIGIENALRKGLLVKAFPVGTRSAGRPAYSVHIQR